MLKIGSLCDLSVTKAGRKNNIIGKVLDNASTSCLQQLAIGSFPDMSCVQMMASLNYSVSCKT